VVGKLPLRHELAEPALRVAAFPFGICEAKELVGVASEGCVELVGMQSGSGSPRGVPIGLQKGGISPPPIGQLADRHQATSATYRLSRKEVGPKGSLSHLASSPYCV
jgi:hypothetical protein